MNTLKTIALAIALLSSSAQAKYTTTYTVTKLATVGYEDMFNTSMGGLYLNNSGHFVGKVKDSKGKLNAIYYDGTKVNPILGTLSSDNITGLNDNDQILYNIGGPSYILNGKTGATTALPQYTSAARGLNNSGQYTAIYEDNKTPTYSLFFDGKTNQKLGINGVPFNVSNNGHITGQNTFASKNLMVSQAFYLDKYSSQPVNLGTLGGPSSWGVAVNNNGYVIGNSDTDIGTDLSLHCSVNCVNHAFLYDGTKMIDLTSLEIGSNSYAHGINNSNIVVGSTPNDSEWASECDPNVEYCALTEAFVYIPSEGIKEDLNNLISASDQKQYSLISAVAINDNGQILVNAVEKSTSIEDIVLLTPQTSTVQTPSIGKVGTVVTTAPTTPSYSVNVSIAMTASSSSVIVNTPITYTITYTDKSTGLKPTKGSGGTVLITLPNNVSFYGSGSNVNCSANGNTTVGCNSYGIDQGKSTWNTFTVMPTATGAYNINATLTVSGVNLSSGTTMYNPVNNGSPTSVSLTTTVTPTPNVTASVTGPQSAYYGTPYVFTETISNTTASTATNVVVRYQTLAKVLSFTSSVTGTYCSITNYVFQCTYPTVGPRQSIVNTITVQYDASGSNDYVETDWTTSTPNVSANKYNTYHVALTYAPNPDVSVTLGSSASPNLKVGTSGSLFVNLLSSKSFANNLVTTVNIPQNIVVTTVPTGCTSKTSPSSTQVTCKLSVLNANKTNQYVVGIKASAASLNFISATVTEDQSDVNNTNNSTNIYITSK